MRWSLKGLFKLFEAQFGGEYQKKIFYVLLLTALWKKEFISDQINGS